MKKSGILNPELIRAVAAIGHTQTFVIGDAGLPVPEGVPVVDLSVTHGVPSFAQVLSAVAGELVIESYVYAEECTRANPEMEAFMQKTLQGLPASRVPHETFKEMTKKAQVVVRTGECSSYANVILVAGVNF